MDRKLLVAIIVSLLLGISGCDDSNKNGVTSAPRKKWVDIRGTDVIVQSQSGAKICVAVPNGVSAVNYNGDMSIKFEDFNDFSDSSVKYPIDYKVGVSSVYIRPESSDDLNKLKMRLLTVGETLIFNFKGFDVYKAKVGDDKTSLKIINVEKAISATFYSGKLLREKYEKDIYLTKLITEISAITHDCTKK